MVGRLPPGENSWWQIRPPKKWTNNILHYGLPPSKMLLIKTFCWLLALLLTDPWGGFTLANSCRALESKESFLEGHEFEWSLSFAIGSMIAHWDLMNLVVRLHMSQSEERLWNQYSYFFNRIPKLFSPKPLLASHLAIWGHAWQKDRRMSENMSGNTC